MSSIGMTTISWGSVSVSVIVGSTGGISVLVSVLVWSVGITSMSVAWGVISVAWATVGWGIMSVSVSLGLLGYVLLGTVFLGSITIVYQVNSTEVGVALSVAFDGGVSGSWGTWLNVRVSVGADHERSGVSVVDSVISTLAGVSAFVLVVTASSSGSDDSEN